MQPFADRLIEAIRHKGNPCIVGLDPRIDGMPDFIREQVASKYEDPDEVVEGCIVEYHRRILDIVAGLVPAVKPQMAFYEQYGIPGLRAFVETVKMAKERGLLVIADAKRNDISSTAQAYANAFLGRTSVMGKERAGFDADCVTINPYLGDDSIRPFIETCHTFGTGVFVLVKTSNPGSKDFQDLPVGDKRTPLCVMVAEKVASYARTMIGDSGYSSIGAVVGATYPAEAAMLRKVMPNSFFLVPGYGAQGGTAKDVVPCFNDDGLGALVNASRSITYAHDSSDIGEEEFNQSVQRRISLMTEDITSALAQR